MAIPGDKDSREHYKFSEPLPNKTAVQVDVIRGGGAGISQWDFVEVTYPDSVTEIYTFYSGTGDNTGTIVGTITVVYTTSSKALILSVEKTPLVTP